MKSLAVSLLIIVMLIEKWADNWEQERNGLVWFSFLLLCFRED